MNYIILAAGKGSRMGNLSSYLQKCMYPILGKPFLEWTLESMASSGRFDAERDRIAVVTGYLGGQIRSYFGDSWKAIPITYADQAEALGTAHAVSVGRGALGDEGPALVVQGDVWAEPGFFAALLDDPHDDALSVVRHQCAYRHDERVDVEGGLVTRAWRGSGPFVECGIWKFSPGLMDLLLSRKVDEYRALPAVQAAIEAGFRVGAVERSGWTHLGGVEPSVEANLAAVHARLAAL